MGSSSANATPASAPANLVKFLRRLDTATDPTVSLHLIVDNASAHKSRAARRWLTRHPRFHLHLIPTSSSWLSLVERWFAEITRQRIRRGTFTSVPSLIAAILDYLDHYIGRPSFHVDQRCRYDLGENRPREILS